MKIKPSYGASRNPRTQAAAWICAGLLVAMLVAQLFSYEDFPSKLDVLLPINDQPTIKLLAAVIVIAELFALPYLLGMYVATLMRVVSALAAVFAAGFWLIMSLTNAHAANSGLFSTTVDLPGGIFAALLSFVVFGMLAKVIYSDSKFRHATSAP